jgi:hypothetical protein
MRKNIGEEIENRDRNEKKDRRKTKRIGPGMRKKLEGEPENRNRNEIKIERRDRE